MTKSKRILFLLMAIGIMIFDQVFQVINYIHLKPYLDKICSDPNFAATFASFVEFIIFGLIYILVFKKKNSNLEKIDENYKRIKLKVHEIILMALGFGGLTGVWLFLVEKYLVVIPFIKHSFDYFNKAMDFASNDGSSFLLALVYGTLLAALMEEVLFRGIIHNCLKISFKSRVLAIIITGIIFGAWHGILVQAVYAAIGGIIFSYIYERTGKLSVTIAIHFINNFLSSIVPEINKVLPGADLVFQIILYLMVPVLFYYLYKIRPKNNLEKINEE